MYWSILTSLLCLILSLSSDVRFCFSSSISLSLATDISETIDLDLHARLISDEIACDFNNCSFCQLYNNGGWSFQQSLMQHAHQNFSSTENVGLTALPKPNNYICADWGGAKENTSSDESTRSAKLQAFISLPSPQQHHLKSGNVFYFGAGSVSSGWTVEKVRREKSNWQKFNLCLGLSVRFSSLNASKLTVKFRSSSQTIEASKIPGPRVVDTMAQTFKEKIIFLSCLAGWIFSLLFSPRYSLRSLSQRQSSRYLKPPVDQWLHFSMPLDTHFIHPESPLPFALYGYNGVCIDNIRVERCATAVLSSLSWPPNNTLHLAFPFPPLTIPSADNSTEYFKYPLFTATFFFTVLLVALLVLLILVCVMSVVYGRKRSNGLLNKKGRAEQKLVPLVLPSMDLMRSPSVSSLPSAVAHQCQIEEISFPINDECVGSLKYVDCPGNGRRRGDLRRPQKRHQSVIGYGNLHSSRYQRFHHQISEQFSSSSASKCSKRQPLAPLLSPQQLNWRRSRKSKSDAINSCSVFQRCSLLSINENNELVLVSPEISNVFPNKIRTRKRNDTSSSAAVTVDATTVFAETSGSSISSSTNYVTTNTTTPVDVCSIGHLLSSLESVATLQEMAASVSQLERKVVSKRNDESDDDSNSSSSATESITSSIACLPPS